MKVTGPDMSRKRWMGVIVINSKSFQLYSFSGSHNVYGSIIIR